MPRCVDAAWYFPQSSSSWGGGMDLVGDKNRRNKEPKGQELSGGP